MKRGISAGSSQSIAGADSAFCLHYKKLPCQTRLAGRILPFCWGRKGESDPPRGAGDLRLHWGKRASQTRLSGRTRELGLSVNINTHIEAWQYKERGVLEVGNKVKLRLAKLPFLNHV